jgi:hypothetical protein
MAIWLPNRERCSSQGNFAKKEFRTNIQLKTATTVFSTRPTFFLLYKTTLPSMTSQLHLAKNSVGDFAYHSQCALHNLREDNYDAKGAECVKVSLLVLGSLRILGSGCTFDCVEELTCVGQDTHRKFFHNVPTTTMSPGVTNQRKGGNWHPSIVHPRTSTNQPNSFQKPYRS